MILINIVFSYLKKKNTFKNWSKQRSLFCVCQLNYKVSRFTGPLSYLLKLINNSCLENKGNYNRKGGLDMWS